MQKKIVGICLLMLLFACKKNTAPTSAEKTNDPGTLNEVASYLHTKGFNVDGLRQIGDDYLIEGDILINQATIRAGMEGTPSIGPSSASGGSTSPTPPGGGGITTNQYAVNPTNSADGTGIIGWANTGNITYFIDPSVAANIPNAADWTNAINTAAHNWTSIANCSLSFTQSATAAGSNLIFYADNAANVPAGGANIPAGTYAWTRLPSNNIVGSAVIINHNPPATDANGKITVITHEMGHAVGMRHADVTVDGEPLSGLDNFNQQVSAPTLLGFSPANDASSIMHSSFAGTGLLNFDTWDLNAARILYPDNIAPTNLTFYTYTPVQGGDRDPPSGLAFYINCNGDTWNLLQVDRLDASNNLISSYTYNAVENNSSYTGLLGNVAPATYPRFIISYETPHGNLPHGTLYFRVSFHNYKNDFGFTLPTRTVTW